MINEIMIDPNGLCNSKCWFCPVAYRGNPDFANTEMDVDLLEKILIDITAAKGIVIDSNFSIIMTAHYNEVLLYKNLEQLLQLFRKYGYKLMICSNGIGLTKKKIDMLNQYADAISGIHLNIPSHVPEKWANLVGSNPKMLNKIMNNIDYAIDTLGEISNNRMISLVVNGISNESFSRGISLMENSPDIDPSDIEESFVFLQKRFPKVIVSKNENLSDRAGHLEQLKVLKNNKHVGKRVIGCSYSIMDRWIYINALGDMFMCCDDFDFETSFANMRDTDIVSLWNNNKRKEAIEKTRDTLCRTCSCAIWED